jgi:hypothetical protein
LFVSPVTAMETFNNTGSAALSESESAAKKGRISSFMLR